MIYEGVLEGRFVNLRSVREDDAEFILNIRNNPEISKYLPPLNVTVEQQRAWITKQRADEDSYYFIIEDRMSKSSIGTIGVYNIDGNHSESGRFCSIGNSIQNSEAALLNGEFVFDYLKLDYLDVWVYKGNKAVLAFNKGFGCVWEGEKEDENGEPFLYGKTTKENFAIKSMKIRKNIKSFKL